MRHLEGPRPNIGRAVGGMSASRFGIPASQNWGGGAGRCLILDAEGLGRKSREGGRGACLISDAEFPNLQRTESWRSVSDSRIRSWESSIWAGPLHFVSPNNL